MKTSWLIVIALCMLLAAPVVAQSSSTSKMEVYVPFNFIVNGRSLPAGNYVVSTYTSGHLLMIQNKDKPAYVTVALNTDHSTRDPMVIHRTAKLIFRLDNGQRVLHQVRLVGDNHAHDIDHGNDVAELVTAQ